MFKNSNENFSNKGNPNEMEPPAFIQEGRYLADELVHDLKLMRLDPEEMRTRYLRIKGGYEDLQSSNSSHFNELDMNTLDDSYGLYERAREGFESSRKNALQRIRNSTSQVADSLLMSIRRLEDESRVGEDIIESKKGLVALNEFCSQLSENMDINRISDDLSSINNLCEINSNINPDSISSDEREGVRDCIRKVRSNLDDMRDELMAAKKLLGNVESEDYEDLARRFGLIASRIDETDSDLLRASRRLEE